MERSKTPSGTRVWKTAVDRTLPLASFQEAVDALAAGKLVGRAVLTP